MANFILQNFDLQFLISPLVQAMLVHFQVAQLFRLQRYLFFAVTLSHLQLQCSIPSNYLRSQLRCMLKSAHCHWYHLLVALQPVSRLFEMLETCPTSFNKMKKYF
jgi:hypothetical protein